MLCALYARSKKGRNNKQQEVQQKQLVHARGINRLRLIPFES